MNEFEAFIAGMVIILMIFIALPKLGNICGAMQNSGGKDAVIAKGTSMFNMGDHGGCVSMYKSFIQSMGMDTSSTDGISCMTEKAWKRRAMIDAMPSTMVGDTPKSM